MHTAPHPTPTPSTSRQHPPSLHAAAVVERVGSPALMNSVGEDLSDEVREQRIKEAGREVEWYMDRHAVSGCFGDRAGADAARLRMEGLIRGRSEAQVTRMEQERGLT